MICAPPERTWFNWTQHPDHGPGAEILSVSAGPRVLDLGCGKGGNLAHLVAIGCRGVGVDVSRTQLRMAHERWHGLELRHEDALAFLEADEDRFDAIYSVFGAVWFVDPGRMLPAVRRRLSGVFAFSYAFMPVGWAVPRWDLEAGEWAETLDMHGFVDIDTWEIPHPEGRTGGTAMVRCRVP